MPGKEGSSPGRVQSIGGMGALLWARAGVGVVQEGRAHALDGAGGAHPFPAQATGRLGLRQRVHPSAVRHSQPEQDTRRRAQRSIRCHSSTTTDSLPPINKGSVLKTSRFPFTVAFLLCTVPIQFGKTLPVMWWQTVPVCSSVS